MDRNEKIEKYKNFSKNIRRLIIKATYLTERKGVHIGSALSVADFFAVLYGGELKVDSHNPIDICRDRFILSKGHAYLALYASLCLSGFITEKELFDNFMTDGGDFPAHPVKNVGKGIECSSGSLGMGLSFAIGKALNAKKKGLDYQTYVVLGDGECNEGSVWEAFMAAVQFKLNNLVVFIDHNNLQHDGSTSDIMNIHFFNVLEAIGWNVISINGNDIVEIVHALEMRNKKSAFPCAIVGNTLKGKGVSFMEGDNNWHHAHLTREQYEVALDDLK